MISAVAATFLRSGSAGVIPFSCSEEDLLELVHSGVREEKCWVTMRDDRSAVNDGVLFGFEEIQK